jgi:protein gp37
MAKVTKISWAHSTFNPWIGCSKVSPACDNCYAEGVAKRMGKKLWGKDAERFFTNTSYWCEPLRWNEEAGKRGEPWRVFCGSLCDVMEDRRDLDERREMLFDLIGETPNLTWLLLSKRPENFLKLTPEEWVGGWPKNVWAMTTAENQRRLDERLPHLLKVPVEVRGLSIEPLLGPIVLPDTVLPCTACRGHGSVLPSFSADHFVPCAECLRRAKALDGGALLGPGKIAKFDTIQWVIVGGESGGGARPMHPLWAKDLRDQCAKHGVAYHFKQWGAWLPISDCAQDLHESLYKPPPKRDPEGTRKCKVAFDFICKDGRRQNDYTHGSDCFMTFRVGERRAGRLLDGKLWDQTPQSMVVPV